MASRKRRPKESAPGWAWMLFGLSIGLAVALVVYLKSGGPVIGPAGSEREARSVELTEPGVSASSQERLPAAAEDSAPAGDTGAAAEAAYSFYEDLGKSEVIVEDDEFDFGPGGRVPQVVLIQAGAFRDIQDADGRQARLALLGYESHIDSAIVNDELYFRVLIGPLTERGDINGTLRRLRSEGIETVVRRVAN